MFWGGECQAFEHGADPHVKNADGYKAMDFALELAPTDDSGDVRTSPAIREEMIKLLEKYD